MGVPARPDAQTIVYRLYGENDRLLYIGLTCNLAQRLVHHRQTKHWFKCVRRVESLCFPDAWSAKCAEESAIARSQPVHNQAHKTDRPHDFLRLCEMRILQCGAVA